MTATFPHRTAAIAALAQLELAVAKAKAIAAAYQGDLLPSVDDQRHDCYRESEHFTAVDVVLARAIEAYEAAEHADGEAYFNPDGTDTYMERPMRIGTVAADCGADEMVDALIAAAPTRCEAFADGYRCQLAPVHEGLHLFNKFEGPVYAAAEPPRPAICIGPGFDRPAAE